MFRDAARFTPVKIVVTLMTLKVRGQYFFKKTLGEAPCPLMQLRRVVWRVVKPNDWIMMLFWLMSESGMLRHSA